MCFNFGDKIFLSWLLAALQIAIFIVFHCQISFIFLPSFFVASNVISTPFGVCIYAAVGKSHSPLVR
ncbi:hypothetical protein NMG60_11029038 [Bertholletia excelsa]